MRLLSAYVGHTRLPSTTNPELATACSGEVSRREANDRFVHSPRALATLDGEI